MGDIKFNEILIWQRKKNIAKQSKKKRKKIIVIHRPNGKWLGRKKIGWYSNMKNYHKTKTKAEKIAKREKECWLAFYQRLV